MMETKYIRLFLLLVGSCCLINQLCSLPSASGELIYWKEAVNGSFHDSTMWSSNRVPGVDDDVLINVTGFYNIIIDDPTLYNNLTIEEEIIINSLKISISNCSCSVPAPCKFYLIISHSFTAVNLVSLFGEKSHIAFKDNATMTTTVFESTSSVLYGTAVINANSSTLTDTNIFPTTFYPPNGTLSPYDLVEDTQIGSFLFTGDLRVSGVKFFFDVVGDEPRVDMDYVFIRGIFSPKDMGLRILVSEDMKDHYYGVEFGNFLFNYTEIVTGEGDNPIGSVSFSPSGPFPGDCLLLLNPKPPCQAGFSVVVGDPYDSYCCQGGWNGPSCDIPNCLGSPDCEGHGSCEGGEENSTPPSCRCFEGWRGSGCTIPDCSRFGGCGGHGNCEGTSGPTQCVCDEGWSGLNCSIATCPGTPQCSNNGVCNTRDNLPVCDCKIGFQGEICNETVVMNDCPSNCSGNGLCNNGTCICDSAYIGNACNIIVCPGKASNCNARGDCIENNGTSQCVCSYGWEGQDCSLAYCPRNCNERGDCISEDLEVPMCDCSFPYIGEDCSKVDSWDIPRGKFKSSTGTAIALGAAFGVVIFGIMAAIAYKNEQKKAVRDELKMIELRVQRASMNMDFKNESNSIDLRD